MLQLFATMLPCVLLASALFGQTDDPPPARTESAPAKTENGGQIDASQPTATDAPQDIKLSVSAIYLAGFRHDIERFVSIGFGASYNQSTTTYSLNLPLTRYFEVDENQDELQLSDAVVGASRSYDLNTQLIGEKKGSLAVSLTLPVSEYSRDQGILTRMRFAAGLTGMMFETVRGAAGTFYSYQWNRYRTTKTTRGGVGGFPLPLMIYGLTGSFGHDFGDRWSVATSGTISELRYEKTEEGEAIIDQAELVDHPYSIDLTLAHRPIDPVSLSLGVSNGSQLVQAGDVEFYIYDEETTRWFLGVSARY